MGVAPGRMQHSHRQRITLRSESRSADTSPVRWRGGGARDQARPPRDDILLNNKAGLHNSGTNPRILLISVVMRTVKSKQHNSALLSSCVDCYVKFTKRDLICSKVSLKEILHSHAVTSADCPTNDVLCESGRLSISCSPPSPGRRARPAWPG